MSNNHPLHIKIKSLIVEQLRLKVDPQSIQDDQSLFTSLGLDSIDALEMIVAMEKEFGVSITSEDVDKKIFETVDSIVTFLKSHAKKGITGNT